MRTNPAVEQNKNIKWSESPWNQSGIGLCTTALYNAAQNSSDNLRSYHPTIITAQLTCLFIFTKRVYCSLAMQLSTRRSPYDGVSLVLHYRSHWRSAANYAHSKTKNWARTT